MFFMDNSTEVPQKKNIELRYDAAIPLICMYPKEMNSGSRRDSCTPKFFATLFTVAKI